MDNRTGVKYSLPPFDVVVCSSWLAVRKCQCPAHIAQSDAVPAAVNNYLDFVDQPDITIRCQQQDMKLPVVNGNTKRHPHQFDLPFTRMLPNPLPDK